MPSFRVEISALDNVLKEIKTVTIARFSEKFIAELALEIETVIKQKIAERSDKREGYTGHLADSFQRVRTEEGWGVGDIAYLNSNAPYWYWQNFGIAQSGRRIPPSNYGYFPSGSPKQGGGRERWIHTGDPENFMIRPNKPLEAKNYIQATINDISQIVESVNSRVKI